MATADEMCWDTAASGFRDGDVVRIDEMPGVGTCWCRPGCIGRVTVDRGIAFVRCDVHDRPDALPRIWSKLTLLRRPLRIGDQLLWRGQEEARLGLPMRHGGEALEITGGRVRTSGGQLLSLFIQDTVRHADGTEIDPPKPNVNAAQPIPPGHGSIRVVPRGGGKKFGRLNAIESVTLSFAKNPDAEPCSAEIVLARTIFKTDPAVIAIVTEKSDCRRVRDLRTYERLQAEGRPAMHTIAIVDPDDHKAYDRAMQIAWERNEGGLATAAKKRAAEIVAALRDGPPEPHRLFGPDGLAATVRMTNDAPPASFGITYYEV